MVTDQDRLMYVLATCPNNATDRLFHWYLSIYGGVDRAILERMRDGLWPPADVVRVGHDDAAIVCRMPRRFCSSSDAG